MKFKIVECLAVALLAGPMTSHALVLYNNFGPGDSFNVMIGITTGPVCSLPAGVNCNPVGMEFVASATGAVTSIDVGMGSLSPPTTVAFGLYSDSAGGTVGTLLENFAVLVSNQFGTQATSSGALSGSPVLTAGIDYWLLATDTAGVNVPWNWNSTGATGDALQAGQYSPGPTIVGTFRVNGIPEPGTLALLGLGLTGFAAWRRRKQ